MSPPEDWPAAWAQIQDLVRELPPEDAALVQAIFDAPDQVTTVARIAEYYHRDADRADRTPRAIIYLHMGMLVAAFNQVFHWRGEVH